MKATVSEDGKTVSFETKHFSTYVVGEGTSITVPDEETATGSGTTTTTEEKEAYVLVSTPTAGKQYLIVNRNTAGSGYALKENTTTGSSITVNAAGNGISAPYIETTDETIMWNTASGMTFQSENGGYYLYYNNGLTFSTRSSFDWSVGENQLYREGTRNDYWLRYNYGWTMGGSGTTYNVYFYEKQTVEVETTTTVSGTYSIEGADETVAAIKDSTFALTSSLVFTPTSGNATTTVDPEGVTYEVYEGGDPLGVISGIDGNTVTLSGKVGKALVKVSYTTDFGEVTDYITVTATTPHHYSVQLHEVELTVAKDVTADNFASNTYYTYDSVTGFYHVATAYAEGTTYYTLPVIQGDAITAPIALKGIEAGDAYSVWAVVKAYASAEDTEGVDVGTLGDALSWTVSDESIATIDTETGVITFTGNNYGTFDVTVAFNGADGKTITDTITISATESLYTVPGDGTNDFPEYPNEGAVRFDKTATAVGNYSETGIAMVELSMTGVPYSTGSELDVVLMLDMTGSMSDDAMKAAEEAAVAFVAQIVKNEDGTYNDNRIAVYAFNSSSSSPFELVSLGTIDSDTKLETANTAIRTASDKQASGGTPYDEALEKCQSVLAAAKTTNLPADVESAADYNRQQFCVFMSDGGPTSFEYITNYDAVKAGTASAYTTATASATGGSNQADSNFATIATYPHEYYSTLMKDDGVTMFSVLTGLSADDYPNCATILENIASSSGNAYVVPDGDDTSAVSGALSSIAQKIVEAAKDVVVEDKIGNNYTLNFSMPTGVSADATDGLTEFYIQAVEYQLNADKERTGDPTVLENFTFDANGAIKSHTVNGTVTCEGTACTHVTFTTGRVTKIEGTYFTYTCAPKLDANGEEVKNAAGDTITEEFLNWEVEKITTTELALQYFAHLDGSTGEDAGSMPAGTYYTNEYATLTYTNYNGNEVQQEFPIPQMTWNGAQVSYVFYLVNDAGQPVNRAGRVVPFAEAVYVTDVYTYSVIWNDLEQSAGLEAKYLAEKLVPDVYALYDDDASYNIHVYEDENQVNLNNHFVIGSDVSDSYNTTEHSWTNAKTTYVFNNKSDSTKYNTVGAYIANDGKDNTTSNAYYCKSAAIEGATYTTSVDAAGVTVYTVTGLGNGYQSISGETQVQANDLPSTTGATILGGYAYYVDENGAVYTIVQKTDGSEVEKGFDFSNTTVAFAVVWKPELVEDTVVIDYGLDVVIDVIRNDNMAAGVVGVRTDKPDADINSGTYTAAKATAVDVYIDSNNDGETLKENKIGTATVENLNSVRFSLDKDNGMQFTDPAVFYYEADVNFYDSNNVLQTTSMYSKVTVIPATTVYYEDEYVDLKVQTQNEDKSWSDNPNLGWTRGNAIGATQAQDRPGESKISAALDADNVYGYDAAYKEMSTYSLGSAAKLNVKSGKRGIATFEFYGTGFDVIGVTSNTTGTITVKVEGATNKSYVVDTYYGYTRNDDGEWVTSVNTPNALYQVPVMKIDNLPYGKYKVTITAAFSALFDHDQTCTCGTGDCTGCYELYLDAIRIYDPTGNLNDEANKAYEADGEAYPEYYELRNKIIEAKTFDSANSNSVKGIVFIDCDDEVDTASIADYISFGPNNEVYLDKGQAIAFEMYAPDDKEGYDPDKIHIGLKSVGGTAKVKISYVNGNEVVTAFEQDIATATDMYYDITALNDKTVVIESVGDAILSITNVKFTYKTEVAAASGSSSSGSSSSGSGSEVAEEAISPFTVRMEDIEVILAYLRKSVEEEIIPEIPEATEPETEAPTEPEVTEPETEPEAAEPETEPTKPSKPTKVDTAELKAAVEAAKKLKEKDYTKESFKALDKAIKSAEKILKDKKATQAENDEALAALNEAVEALETNAPATKPGKEEKPEKDTKPGKDEKSADNKPGKPENNNQNKPANNKGPVAAVKYAQKVADTVGAIAEALFGWLFR